MDSGLWICAYRDIVTSLREKERPSSDRNRLILARAELMLKKDPVEVLDTLRGLEQPLTRYCPVQIEPMKDSKEVVRAPDYIPG